MLFNSLRYGAFLVVVALAYRALPRRGQNLLLLVASYAFYAAWDARFLGLIVLSTVVDYVAGRRIASMRDSGLGTGRMWLGLSLVVNLGLLAVFKYLGFFVESAQSLLTSFGLQATGPTLDIILPVGISFYTFQTLSYTIDVFRGNLGATRSPLDFAVYVAFFPQLVAGPIERASRLLPQISNPRTVTGRDVTEGVALIATGLVRKVVIADTAAVVVDRHFADPAAHGAFALITVLLLYGLQIYGDFAGYSNIARGSARFFGIELMRNFRHPYLATSIADFWHRWHISLSTWLRDYLYVPLGGNRRGPRRTLLNLALVMLLGGLWHGAGWTFVVWGALHGGYLVTHRLWRARRPAREGRWSGLTLLVVMAAWLPFRAPDLATMLEYLEGMARWESLDVAPLMTLLILGAVLMLIDLPQHRSGDEYVAVRLSAPAVGYRLGFAVLLVVLFGGTAEPFVYFQF